MSVISVPRKEAARDDKSKPRSGYMTTTELARLCGVSRFTIINWAKQGKIKTIRTIGRHYRIQVSEALSLLRNLEEKEKASSSGPREDCRQQTPTTNSDEECGNCLAINKKDKRARAERRNVLHSIGYGIGRGVYILKGRNKVK